MYAVHLHSTKVIYPGRWMLKPIRFDTARQVTLENYTCRAQRTLSTCMLPQNNANIPFQTVTTAAMEDYYSRAINQYFTELRYQTLTFDGCYRCCWHCYVFYGHGWLDVKFYLKECKKMKKKWYIIWNCHTPKCIKPWTMKKLEWNQRNMLLWFFFCFFFFSLLSKFFN